jgi:hypothetical protein
MTIDYSADPVLDMQATLAALAAPGELPVDTLIRLRILTRQYALKMGDAAPGVTHVIA